MLPVCFIGLLFTTWFVVVVSTREWGRCAAFCQVVLPGVAAKICSVIIIFIIIRANFIHLSSHIMFGTWKTRVLPTRTNERTNLEHQSDCCSFTGRRTRLQITPDKTSSLCAGIINSLVFGASSSFHSLAIQLNLQ